MPELASSSDGSTGESESGLADEKESVEVSCVPRVGCSTLESSKLVLMVAECAASASGDA